MGGATGHIFSDVIGNRPAFGMADRYFWSTDEHILYRDTGAAWVKVAVADYPDLDSIPASFTPSAHSHLTVAETEVFSGNSPSPSAWTDLNLSGTIGENAALVLLKVWHSEISLKTVAFRKNGDTNEFYHMTAKGCAAGDAPQDIHQVFLVATDDTGVIEWKLEGINIASTIDIIAYIK